MKSAIKDATTERSQTPQRQDDDEFTRSTRLSWALSVRRVYEVDPRLTAELEIS